MIGKAKIKKEIEYKLLKRRYDFAVPVAIICIPGPEAEVVPDQHSQGKMIADKFLLLYVPQLLQLLFCQEAEQEICCFFEGFGVGGWAVFRR